MRNEQLYNEIIKLQEGQKHIADKLKDIHETDKEQSDWLRKNNGRIGKLEVKVEALEEDQDKLEEEQKEQASGFSSFIDKNPKLVIFIMMALLGFGPEILKLLTAL